MSTEIAARETAGARAIRIRRGIHAFLDTLDEIAAAFAARDWATLGYPSWQAYVDGEFGEQRLQLSAPDRIRAVEQLRMTTMSQRAIGTVLGVNAATVNRDLAELRSSGVADATPEVTLGADGKNYPAARPAVPAGGPEPGDQVWIAAARKGIEAHRLKSISSTGCDRSTRTGLTLPAGQAAEKHEATWCPRCWPQPTDATDAECGNCQHDVPADQLGDPALPGWCALCRVRPPDGYVITSVPYSALVPGDYVEVEIGAALGWERVVRAARRPGSRLLVDVWTDLAGLPTEDEGPRWDPLRDSDTITISRASGRTVAADGVAVCVVCRSQVPGAVTYRGKCPGCVDGDDKALIMGEKLTAQDPRLTPGPEQSMVAAQVRAADLVWVEPGAWQPVTFVEIVPEPDEPGEWLVRARTRRSTENTATSSWGWSWDEPMRVRRPEPATAAPSPAGAEDLGDTAQETPAAGKPAVPAASEPAPRPLTEQEIGRLRLAFAHAHANGWRHVDWDGTPMTTRLERDYPTARIEVGWDVNESELQIGYSSDQYRTRDDVLWVADVGEALDVLCVLGHLPLDQSSQYCAGLLDGVRACQAEHPEAP